MNPFKRKFLGKLTRTFGIGLHESIEKFGAEIGASGLTPPTEIHADGQIHRFSTNGRLGDTSGWYVLYSDPIPAGAYGCWRSQISQTWRSKPDASLSDHDQKLLHQQLEKAKLARDDDQKKRHEAAAQKAQQRLSNAVVISSHPYLDRKNIQPHGLRSEQGLLLIPMFNAASHLTSLQTIDGEGGKRFMSGGQVAGCFHLLGKPTSDIVICEGFATGATIHELTGKHVAVAFSAGNLPPVAKIMRERFPQAQIIIAADNDAQTPGNPGLTKAKEAASAVAGRIAIPKFPAGSASHLTDFNDLFLSEGADVVIDCIDTSPAVSRDGVVWPKPRPVAAIRPSVADLHDDLIPEALRDWIMDISVRMGCKPDFPAVAALVALSSLVGARAAIAPKSRDTWTVVPTLWGQIISPPGTLKSPALGEAMRALNRLDRNDREMWSVAHKAWEAEVKLQKLTSDATDKEFKVLVAKDPNKARSLLTTTTRHPEEPKLRRRILNDSTVEKLGEVLAEHPQGLLVYRDELHGLLSQMDRAGQEGARSFYLQGFDGNQPYTVDRIRRGTLHIPRVCIAMLGGIQPGLLDEYVQGCVDGRAGNDGLLQRFSLSVWPDQDANFKYVDQAPDEVAQERAYAIFEQLDKLAPGLDGEPALWRYSPGAQSIFRDWLIELEKELRSSELSPALTSHFSKYRKLVPALSLLFALIDTPDTGKLVAERELMRAIRWARYLRSHAERMYALQSSPITEKASMLLNKLRECWSMQNSADVLSFTPREVALKGWAGLGNSDDVRKAAKALVDHGWLRREVVASADAKGRGRPSEQYLIHPALAQV